MKSVLRTLFLYTSFILVLASYMPFIFQSHNLYELTKIIYLILFGCLFLVTFSIKEILSEKVIVFYLFIIIFFLTEILLFLSLGLNIDFKDFFLLSIPFISILIGYTVNISVTKYITFLIVYCSFTVILAVSTILYYVGSFTIMDQYMVDHKNSLGAILSNSIGILICMIASKNLNSKKKTVLIIYTIIICSSIIVMRSRAAFLGLLFCVMIIIWLNLKKKGYWYLISAGLLLLILLLSSYGLVKMPVFINDFFIGAYDINDLNNLSSGRWDRNIAAIRFISDFPLLGNLTGSSYIPQIHNYVLLKGYQYGLLGALPLLILYIYLVCNVVKRVVNIRDFGPEHFGFIIIFIPLVISLFEYSFPYGPGSVQVIVFFMLGYSLNKSKQV
ncbi:MAG: hypothetical protein JXB17_13975 [Bacteroidales bacterium]|nr:hypothetical protein [Bacteroidales bacterium]